jgi:hypothetical protein
MKPEWPEIGFKGRGGMGSVSGCDGDLTRQTGNQAAYKAITADVIGLIINQHYANRPLATRLEII